jgi:hypothetical protein
VHSLLGLKGTVFQKQGYFLWMVEWFPVSHISRKFFDASIKLTYPNNSENAYWKTLLIIPSTVIGRFSLVSISHWMPGKSAKFTCHRRHFRMSFNSWWLSVRIFRVKIGAVGSLKWFTERFSHFRISKGKFIEGSKKIYSNCSITRCQKFMLTIRAYTESNLPMN